jgi:NAD(P)H-dependent FMN reductase
MPKIAIIIGSTRPGRVGEAVARWVHENASERAGVEYEIVDLLDYDLPHLDEALPPAYGQYANEHTKLWAAKIDEFDGYIFVTPEYNHSTSGALKNSIDFLSAEWNNKAAGFVSYGVFGGARAVEHLRLVLSQLKVATVSAHVGLGLATDFEDYSVFKPAAYQQAGLTAVFDEVEQWSEALSSIRDKALEEVAA